MVRQNTLYAESLTADIAKRLDLLLNVKLASFVNAFAQVLAVGLFQACDSKNCLCFSEILNKLGSFIYEVRQVYFLITC